MQLNALDANIDLEIKRLSNLVQMIISTPLRQQLALKTISAIDEDIV
jgi:hypothetical protein